MADCRQMAVPLLGQSFRFRSWYDAESLVISLQTLFIDTPARSEPLSIVGNIRAGAQFEDDDKGATQSVTVRKGHHAGGA